MTAEENIATIRRSIQALNDRDLSIIPQIVAPGFVRHDLADAFEDVKGPEGVTDFLQLVLKALPDLQGRVEDIFATEKRVALHVTYSGTHQGEFLGAAPTGKKVKYSGVNLYRFEEGKIAETWQLMDVAGFMRQIGALTLKRTQFQSHPKTRIKPRFGSNPPAPKTPESFKPKP